MLDTHVLLWWLGAASNLSTAAKRVLRRVSAEHPAHVSSISLFEISTASATKCMETRATA